VPAVPAVSTYATGGQPARPDAAGLRHDRIFFQRYLVEGISTAGLSGR
jgi:hypothetical protein